MSFDALRWSTGAGKSPGPAASEVARWAEGRNIDGIVWTALGPKIRGVYQMPSVHEVIDHLRSLQGVECEAAKEYVRLAPKQIATQYRRQIEDSLGWTPTAFSKATRRQGRLSRQLESPRSRALTALRGPGESYSDVILRLAEASEGA